MELLYLGGDMAAGELGSRRTTGSMTALVKRLMVAELVIRRINNTDLCRVILSVNPERVADVREIRQGL